MKSFGSPALAVLVAVGVLAPAAAEDVPAVSGPKATWDQAANIRDAAERIARIQRTKGADGAIKFIDACYRTHSLAETYSAAFEGCIAQDYLETKLLTRIYSRLPDETLKKLRAPTAEALAQAMGRRVVAAFRQYNVTAAEAEAFKGQVDHHGLPVFLKIVFPEAEAEIEAREKARAGEAGGTSEQPSETNKNDNGKN